MLVTDAEGKAGWEDKLCWAEEAEVEFLPETVLEGADGQFMSTAPLVADLTNGNTYTVNYNGTNYLCTAKYLSEGAGGYYCLGDLGTAGLPGEATTGEPFVVMVAPSDMVGPSDMSMMLIALDGAETVTLSIRGIAEQVKKIDAKYAPGYVFGEFPYKDKVFLKETTVSGISYMGVSIMFDAALIPNQVYTVTCNGTAYTVIAEKDQTFVSAFSLKPTNEDGDVVCQIVIQNDTPKKGAILPGDSGDESCTLSIVGSGVETVKVPGKLMEDAALPLVVTVVMDNLTVESVSHTYDEIEATHRKGRALFCLLTTEKTSSSDYLLTLHTYDFTDSSFTFRATSWAYDKFSYPKDFEVIIDKYDGTTIRKVESAVSSLLVHADGGLRLTSATGKVFKLTVSDDGILTATAL